MIGQRVNLKIIQKLLPYDNDYVLKTKKIVLKYNGIANYTRLFSSHALSHLRGWVNC